MLTTYVSIVGIGMVLKKIYRVVRRILSPEGNNKMQYKAHVLVSVYSLLLTLSHREGLYEHHFCVSYVK